MTHQANVSRLGLRALYYAACSFMSLTMRLPFPPPHEKVSFQSSTANAFSFLPHSGQYLIGPYGPSRSFAYHRDCDCVKTISPTPCLLQNSQSCRGGRLVDGATCSSYVVIALLLIKKPPIMGD